MNNSATSNNGSNNGLTFSQIKEIKNFCEDLHSMPCYRSVIENVLDSESDFEVDNVRFIKDENILETMASEIFDGDDYVLGCFNADFISDNSSLNYELVKACQEADAYQAIGKALNDTMDQDEKESFCEEYVRVDGYGHHFNHYDFSEEEITINGELYHVFDNRN